MVENTFLKRLSFAWKFLINSSFASWTMHTLKYAFACHEKVRGSGSSDVIIWSKYLNNDIFSEKELKSFEENYLEFKIPSAVIAENLSMVNEIDDLQEIIKILKRKQKRLEILKKLK